MPVGSPGKDRLVGMFLFNAALVFQIACPFLSYRVMVALGI